MWADNGIRIVNYENMLEKTIIKYDLAEGKTFFRTREFIFVSGQ